MYMLSDSSEIWSLRLWVILHAITINRAALSGNGPCWMGIHVWQACACMGACIWITTAHPFSDKYFCVISNSPNVWMSNMHKAHTKESSRSVDRRKCLRGELKIGICTISDLNIETKINLEGLTTELGSVCSCVVYIIWRWMPYLF